MSVLTLNILRVQRHIWFEKGLIWRYWTIKAYVNWEEFDSSGLRMQLHNGCKWILVIRNTSFQGAKAHLRPRGSSWVVLRCKNKFENKKAPLSLEHFTCMHWRCKGAFETTMAYLSQFRVRGHSWEQKKNSYEFKRT